MKARPVMPKKLIQQRLHVLIPAKGRPVVNDLRLKIADVSDFIGVRGDVLYKVAHKRREVDDALQVTLSNFFALVDDGCIVKVLEGSAAVVRRVPCAPDVVEQPKAKIDLSGLTPRVVWR